MAGSSSRGGCRPSLNISDFSGHAVSVTMTRGCCCPSAKSSSASTYWSGCGRVPGTLDETGRAWLWPWASIGPQISAYQALCGKDRSVSFPVCHKRIQRAFCVTQFAARTGLGRAAGPYWPCAQMLRSCQQAPQEGSESAHLQCFPDQGSQTQEPAWATYMYGGSGRGLEWFETHGGFLCC